MYLKARVAVLILDKGSSPDHCNGFQVSLAVGLADGRKAQDSAFTWCERELSLAGIGRRPPEL